MRKVRPSWHQRYTVFLLLGNRSAPCLRPLSEIPVGSVCGMARTHCVGRRLQAFTWRVEGSGRWSHVLLCLSTNQWPKKPKTMLLESHTDYEYILDTDDK